MSKSKKKKRAKRERKLLRSAPTNAGGSYVQHSERGAALRPGMTTCGRDTYEQGLEAAQENLSLKLPATRAYRDGYADGEAAQPGAR